jgi:hypothetical protein
VTSIDSPVSEVSDLLSKGGSASSDEDESEAEASTESGETAVESNQATASAADSTAAVESETAEAADEETVPELSVDVIFEVLKNERRRRVIEYLRTHEGPAELGAVAEHIAALENDKEEAAITYAERKRVYVGLYQCHLPKMDDMGVVDFNRARGRIELTEQTHHLLPYLDGPRTERQWYRYYGAVVFGGFGLYALAVTPLLPTVMAVQVALVAVLVALAVCTAVHGYAGRDSAESVNQS